MQVVDKALETEYVGRDFLTWLWFKSETGEGRFRLDKAGDVELWFDGPVTLQSEGSAGAEKVVCSNEALTEARFALTEGRKVVKATIRVKAGEDEWVCGLDSLWLNFRGVRLPKTVKEKEEDREGIFYERAFLIERLVGIMDEFFALFLKLRLSGRWREEEFPLLKAWVNGSSNTG